MGGRKRSNAAVMVSKPAGVCLGQWAGVSKENGEQMVDDVR